MLDKFINRFSGFSEIYSFYDGEVEIMYDKDAHTYLLVQGDELIPQPSVTTIVKESVNKSEILIPWACKMMGEKIVKSIPQFPYTLTETGTHRLINKCKGAHREKLDEAGMLGNMAHNWIEKYINNRLVNTCEYIPDPNMPQDERVVSAINAALDWMKAHNVRWISTERKIYSRIHKYAGTMDGLALTDSCSDPTCCPQKYTDRLSLVDWKTSNNLYLDYLFQISAYWGAYREETGIVPEDGWVIRLGKEDAEFDPWHIWDTNEFEIYYYGFLNSRKWYESMKYAEEQVKIKNERLRDLRAEQRKKIKEEQLAIKCKNADKYKGMRYPVCNGGNPCQACLAKWAEQHPITESALDKT